MNLNNLMRQHGDISDEIRLVKEMINKNIMELKAIETRVTKEENELYKMINVN
ncbi:hypothetical protein [uncultured Clostridium sp.]|uniref:hypothetical protein n=1 Tax=uncultured Clostridium sp. TaxID=59620 RepID=UPI0032168A2A